MKLQLKLFRPRHVIGGYPYPQLLVYGKTKRADYDLRYFTIQDLICKAVGHKPGPREVAKYTGDVGANCTRCSRWMPEQVEKPAGAGE